MANYKLTKKSVNSKRLFNEIHEFIEDGIVSGGIMWSGESHRESFVSIIEEFLEEFHQDGKISQCNVICDYRNNSPEEMDKGNYTLFVHFKQKNCLNTTKLIYNITCNKGSIYFNIDEDM